MEIFLALIFGLAVACVVFVLGRTFVGLSGNVAEQTASRSELLHFANASPDDASAIVENVGAIEASHPAASVSEQRACGPAPLCWRRGASEQIARCGSSTFPR